MRDAQCERDILVKPSVHEPVLAAVITALAPEHKVPGSIPAICIATRTECENIRVYRCYGALMNSGMSKLITVNYTESL